MSTPSVDELLGDLDAERTAVMDLIRSLGDEGWGTPTRALPWTVRDQVAHLGWFDAAFARAISTPDDFVAERDAVTDIEAFVAAANDQMPAAGADALAWWQGAARAFDDAARSCDPSARLPWYGPAMSLRSAITSRIMETWAHGADIADALGTHLEPTDRLRHVADIAVRARAQGYRIRGLEPPTTPVRVELAGPSGATWSWGERVELRTLSVSDGTRLTSGDEIITGDAQEFCLVLIRRVHVDDTALRVEGAAAREWMEIGQSFAGTPGADPVRGVAR